MFPKKIHRVLMVEPNHFEIKYAINSHMLGDDGKLNQIDKLKAREQWSRLKTSFENLGVTVDVLPSRSEFPDMVFSANQVFPFISPKTEKPTVVLGKMKYPERRGEVAYFQKWFQVNSYDVEELESSVSFEGNGDLVPHPGRSFFWGGVGVRTDQAAYDEMASRWQVEVKSLPLVHEDFYHLDTCFAALSESTCAVIFEAIHPDGLMQIRQNFSKVIRISLEEGKRFFAANCFSPDGKNVILQKGAANFCGQLKESGLVPNEVETSEFIKAGGSVFCLKLALPK